MAYVQVGDSADSRPRVLRPGIRAPSPGTERYVIPGGGCVGLQVAGGDRVRVLNPEGRQPCELVVFNTNGESAPGILGVEARGDVDGIKAIFARMQGTAGDVLRRQNLKLDRAKSIDVFGREGPAGEEAAFTASDDATILIGTPGSSMRVDEQNPPTEIEVFIERASHPDESEGKLPEPLADPRFEQRIERSRAGAYEVKAAEWIQVIDVFGRQCSDFQVFSAAMLDKGIERCLDVTTTRSLMGQGYPQPGSTAKYYDQDMRPLFELVLDDCSRHDAFGLACTAKYYEDAGYPGHVNCSDNFNAALEAYPIAPRRGWMAMNFFYNTGVDEQNQFYFDEPWSRPGDSVLMRAIEDLVCVSSACPDDIDAANGWDPTDIHVRVYQAKEEFKRSIGFRKRPDSEAEMTRETGFHPRTSALTRSFGEYNGFWIPNSYPTHGAIAEYWACREKVIVMDLSALRKFEVVGPDAETLLQYCLTRDIRRLAAGQIVYTAMCYDTGTMIDDGTLFRLGPDNFRWIGGCDFGGEWLREKAAELNLQVWVKSATDQLHNLAVQGPESRDILNKIVWTPPAQPSVAELGWFRFTIGRIGDYEGIPVIVSRTGYTGELGYEVWCHPSDAPAVWDAIWEAGKSHELAPLGLEALDMLRIESGLIFAGHEFDDQTDPFEAGIGFTVALKSKQEDFIGREALLRRQQTPQRKLVGLELVGEEVAAHGDCVHVGRQQVGIVTSATRSPIMKKNIALCRVAIEYAEPGMEVEVGKLDGHQKRLPATVVAFPAYDPHKERPRS